MGNFGIGVMLESFRLGFEKGVLKAAELGADGLQMYFTSPEPVSAAEIARMRAFIRDAGLEVSAVCGDIGSYTDPERNSGQIRTMDNIFAFASELGTKVVTGHIGVLPADENAPAWIAAHDAMQKLGAMAKGRGLTFAVETGPEDTELLGRFLDGLDGGVGVNFDPANLVMGGFSKDGADSVAAVSKYIVHTHAKDGLPPTAAGGPREVALGSGAVDFEKWLKELSTHSYHGFLTIEREVGDDPVADIAQAVRYLRTIDSGL